MISLIQFRSIRYQISYLHAHIYIFKISILFNVYYSVLYSKLCKLKSRGTEGSPSGESVPVVNGVFTSFSSSLATKASTPELHCYIKTLFNVLTKYINCFRASEITKHL